MQLYIVRVKRVSLLYVTVNQKSPLQPHKGDSISHSYFSNPIFFITTSSFACCSAVKG